MQVTLPEQAPRAVLATVSSDSHTWNLIYLQMVLEEAGLSVTNLGACTPVNEIISTLERTDADLLVISSVNGHGATEAVGLIQQVRASAYSTPAVIGGKLGCGDPKDGEIPQILTQAGFDAVYMDGTERAHSVIDFTEKIRQLVESHEIKRQGLSHGLS